MTIQEFYEKLTAAETNALFEALRRLTLIEKAAALREAGFREWQVWSEVARR